jgi:ribonuclease HI
VTIDAAHAGTTIYTDGSASGGTTDGGSAVVITTGTAEEFREVAVLRCRSAGITSSFEEEREALRLAAEWINANDPPPPVLVCSDSQSALSALAAGSSEMSEVRQLLDSAPTLVHLQWIPGHCDLPGNDRADEEAKRAAASTDQGQRPVTLASARALVKRTIADPPPTHPRVAAVYGNTPPSLLSPTSREEEVLVAQLRSGHCPRLRAYRKLVDPTADPLCQRCQEEEETVEHWLQRCPALVTKRLDEFGTTDPPLSVLATAPRAVALLARRTIPWQA